MSRPAAHPRPMWSVTIEAHTVGRHDVPAQSVKIGSPTEALAREVCLRMHYAVHEVPQMKPFLRESWAHTSAEQIRDEVWR